MVNLKQKIAKLCKAFKPKNRASLEESREQFHKDFLQYSNLYDTVDNIHQETKNIDNVLMNKVSSVLNSKQIKGQSARIMENVKREAES